MRNNTTTTNVSSRTRRPTTTPVTPYMSRPTTNGLLTFSKLNATKTATQNNIHKGTMALLKAKRKTKLVGIGRRPHDRTLFDCLQEYPQDGENGRLVKLNEFMDVTSAAKTVSSDKGAEVEESSMIALSSLSATIATTEVANDQPNVVADDERNDDDDDAVVDKEKQHEDSIGEIIKEEMEVQTSGSIDYCVGENGTIIILDDRDDSYGDKYFYRGEDEVNSLLHHVATTSELEKNHDLFLREIDLDSSSDDDDDEIDSLVKFCGWGEAMNLMTITC